MTTNHITTTTFFKWSPFFRIILHLSLLLLIQFYRYSSFKIWPHKQQAAQMRPNNSSQSNRQIKNEQHKLYHSTNALLQTHCPHLLCNTQKQIENLCYLVLFPWKNVFLRAIWKIQKHYKEDSMVWMSTNVWATVCLLIPGPEISLGRYTLTQADTQIESDHG